MDIKCGLRLKTHSTLRIQWLHGVMVKTFALQGKDKAQSQLQGFASWCTPGAGPEPG